MNALTKHVTRVRNTIIVYPSPHHSVPNFHAPELATTTGLEELPLPDLALLAGGLVLVAVTLMALMEFEPKDEFTAGVVEALSIPVFPTHSVERKNPIIAASVGFVCEACRHEIHAGPLAEIVGQRHARLVNPHDEAAAATLWHCGAHIVGFAHVLRAAATSAASVAFIKTVSKQEMQGVALRKTVGQRQS